MCVPTADVHGDTLLGGWPWCGSHSTELGFSLTQLEPGGISSSKKMEWGTMKGGLELHWAADVDA